MACEAGRWREELLTDGFEFNYSDECSGLVLGLGRVGLDRVIYLKIQMNLKIFTDQIGSKFSKSKSNLKNRIDPISEVNPDLIYKIEWIQF